MNNTLPPPEICEKYAGEWSVLEFPDIQEESKIICGNKPCWQNSRVLTTYLLTCKSKVLTGEVILLSPTAHEEPSNVTPKKPPVTPDKKFEIKVPIKESRIEKDSLFLSFEETTRGCLVEIKVSPKGEFLIGTFENKNCQRPSDLQQMYNKNKMNIKIDYDKGGILFVNKQSKTAF